MEGLLNRSALLREAILSTVDHPLADDSPRLLASMDAALLSLEHADALRTLLQAGMASSAMALMRCQYEAFTRSVWILHCAADVQVELLSLPPEAGMSEKGLPTLSKMLEAFAKVAELDNLLPHLIELKVHAWAPLNSFVHAGVHAMSRSRVGFSMALAINVIRMSNNLSMMAGQHLATLTGVPGLQKEVLRLDETFAECLLFDEEKRRTIETRAPVEQSS
ncbi:DUF6988 family protein [Stenotrophomonas maltophilia]|uniref:DUF6988 family protein n=1 Tax=Stenotrophomonas maltophilia TaxID=40324 RepID=UPI000746056A|nr:hypothetical protein [Stenotrophomonas maltophilia]KUJ05162.1 hypothetical protein AR275_33625 [Stenotrophomonas maltophilia]MBA0445041.1 hypothetical protein [Stenotrophomonas maltophilia]BBQ10051.1 hypothetical protein WP1W18C01_04110 [Stenotrophomonas maltophilia]